VRLEASPGVGWSMTVEARLESRGTPGPSPVVDAPIRRHAALLRVGWERAGSHLRADWQGRLDIELPPGGTAVVALDRVQDLASIRGRRAVSRRLWVGGGVARFRVPAALPAVTYEERPAGLSPAVTVRGEGSRLHAAFEVKLSRITLGAFGARQVQTGHDPEYGWAAGLRWSANFASPITLSQSESPVPH
jgi:hypothetical protein